MPATSEPPWERATLPGKLLFFLATSIVCGFLAAGLLVPPAAAAGASVAYSSDVLDDLPADLTTGPMDEASRIVSADGELIATFYAENRQPVPLEEISQTMQDAIIAIEDDDFYEHAGVDLQAVVRAAINNLVGGSLQGASTLTMQYVNNVLIDRDQAAGKSTDELTISGTKDLADKVREARLALAVEQQYSKDKILQGYLNIVLFGGRTYGVEAAAQRYFGVDASELDIAQSAMLAGMVQAPNYFDPVENPEATLNRRNVVLKAMLDTGKINAFEYDKAVGTGLGLDLHPEHSGCVGAAMADYFCSYVEQVIMQSEAYGADATERAKLLARGGLTITTTLDTRLQQEAQEQVEAHVPVGDSSGAGSAIVSVEPGTGRILAMAQNTEYSPSGEDGTTELNFNVDPDMGGTPFGFQPGSTMKPFTTVTWLESGRGLNETIDASRTYYPAGYDWTATCLPADAWFSEWDFRNALPGYERTMTVSQGLTWSVNSATAAQAAQLDLCEIRDAASRMGVHRAVDGEPMHVSTPSFVIGGQEVSPLTMAAAYATFAADGTYCVPIALESVTDNEDNHYPVPESDCHQAIDAGVAAAVTVPLQNLVESRPGSIEPIGVPAAAKTGTTDKSEQTWTVGYTKGIATASWVGNWTSYSSLNSVPINGVTRAYVDGSSIAGGQWTGYMREVAGLYQGGAFSQPPSYLLY